MLQNKCKGINKQNVNCRAYAKKGYEFCHNHIKSNKNSIANMDFYKELNKNFIYTLMNLYESWDEIPINQIINLDGEYWQIDIVVNHISYQLNSSNMENPYPIFPSNPFNRKLFSIESLLSLRNYLKEKNKKVNIGLKYFLNNDLKTLKLFYNESQKTNDRFCLKLLNKYKSNLRFMIVNNKNSQNHFQGVWIRENYPKQQFERLYDYWKNVSYQIILAGRITDNVYKKELKKRINSIPEDNYDLNAEFISEIF